MEPTKYLFELINQSNISLLGYSFKEERIKDEIISKVSHIELPEINSSFSMLSYIRDSKIDSILGNDVNTPTHFLLDINNFMVGRGETSRANVINNTLRKIADELIDSNFKLLITCPIYNSVGNDEYNFSGGNTGLYMADFVGIIRKDRVRIMKNCEGGSQIDIKYDSK
jgi:hypothetical protein